MYTLYLLYPEDLLKSNIKYITTKYITNIYYYKVCTEYFYKDKNSIESSEIFYVKNVKQYKFNTLTICANTSFYLIVGVFKSTYFLSRR